MVDAQRFRTVWFVEGVRVPDALIVADVAIIPFPSVAITRDLTKLITEPLEQLGFATAFNAPAIIASGSASRPVVGLVIEAETTDIGAPLRSLNTGGTTTNTSSHSGWTGDWGPVSVTSTTGVSADLRASARSETANRKRS